MLELKGYNLGYLFKIFPSTQTRKIIPIKSQIVLLLKLLHALVWPRTPELQSLESQTWNILKLSIIWEIESVEISIVRKQNIIINSVSKSMNKTLIYMNECMKGNREEAEGDSVQCDIMETTTIVWWRWMMMDVINEHANWKPSDRLLLLSEAEGMNYRITETRSEW